MAASKSYCARANYRFLPNDQALSNDPMIFELDESDVWNAAVRSQSPEIRKTSNSRLSRKPSSVAGGNGRVGGPSSLPVNVPDWSKILKDEYMDNRRRESDDYYDEDDCEESGDRIPPHEFLARQMARTRISSFSVHEGIGRTLKGRDLSRVRNAIWQKTGFED
ncbi:protein S40-4 [Salvia miltiorrhiza]|uniref:protein S40-4-like n=1 Tax=Salvia miltiorrhiza TaxID=226208 RepID=UPI0025AC8B9B|nr:protein S40-4-like [Salvia miltiorrhiza]XP_057782640.1 protein S40-4 [Salvia miltiorrhiza]